MFTEKELQVELDELTREIADAHKIIKAETERERLAVEKKALIERLLTMYSDKRATSVTTPTKVKQAEQNGSITGKIAEVVASGNGLTLDEVWESLTERGVTMAGKRPRGNLSAFLSGKIFRRDASGRYFIAEHK